MGTKVRIVFQGGGARLVNLLAAAEAIRELETSGKIEVTHVAGTSAGAIVAALFAAQRNPGDLKQALSLEKDRLLSTFPKPSKGQILWRLLLGISIWDIKKLRAFLVRFIPENLKFKDAHVPISVVAANLQERAAHKYCREMNPDQTILNAVIDSAAVPFGFRVWNRQEGAILVDGGLCENLPIDAVGGTDKDGKVVAVGFEKPIGAAPTTITEFGLALLDVAINNSETKARALLPSGRILLLNAKIPTFDFHRALNEGLGDGYDLIKLQVSDFFNDFIQAETVKAAVLVEGMDTWRHSDSVAREIMLGLGEMYFSQHAGRKIFYKNATYEITAYSLAQNSGRNKDTTKLEFQIEALDEPVFCMAFAIDRPPGSKFTGMMEVNVWGPDQKPVALKLLPMLKPDDPDAYRRVCVFFTPPLPARSGPYRVVLLDEPTSLLERLKKGEPDEMSFGLPRASEPVDIKLVLHIPKAFPELSFSAKNGTHPGILEKVQSDTDYGFHKYIWTGKKVPPGVKLAAEIKRA